MKRFVICIILVALMLVLACGCYIYTQTVTENVGQRLADISSSYEDGDIDRARILSREVDLYWRGYCACSVFVTDRESAAEITSTITKMSAMIENGDEGFINECSAAIRLTGLYREKQSLRLCNIF